MQDITHVEILLIEDNPDDIALMKRALIKHNLVNRIFILNDGQEALDFIFGKGNYEGRQIENRPKVIFLDLKLPKVHGLEVLRIIKTDERTKKIPVVIVTSSREERDVVESYNYGVNSYVVKPVEFEKFVEAMATLGLYWLLLNEPPLG